MRADPVALIETAYRFNRPMNDWLEDLASHAQPWNAGGGIITYAVDPRAPSARITNCREVGTEQTHLPVLQAVTNRFPAPLMPSIFAATEFVGNCEWRIRRLAHAMKVPVEALTVSEAGALPPMWALIAANPTGPAVVVAFPAKATDPVRFDQPFHPRSASKLLGQVGAHLSAALRLRAHLAPPEAVLTPTGKVLHLEAPAQTSAGRGALIEAVLASERARGRLRRVAPDEAVETWNALVAGQWTILETIERDGKRLLLAQRNRAGRATARQLSPLEAEVAFHIALGHSNKYVAYELGLPLSTVIARVRSAYRKLGVTNRAGLVKALGH